MAEGLEGLHRLGGIADKLMLRSADRPVPPGQRDIRSLVKRSIESRRRLNTHYAFGLESSCRHRRHFLLTRVADLDVNIELSIVLSIIL
jgi:hypothetical protein